MNYNQTPQPEHSGISKVFLSFGALIAVAISVFLVPVPLEWKEQAVVGVATVLAAIIINRRSRAFGTLLLMSVSTFSTLRYAWWRIAQTSEAISAGGTKPFDLVLVFLLLAAEAYAVVILLLGYFQTIRPLHRVPICDAGRARRLAGG